MGVNFFLIFWQNLKRKFGGKESSYEKKIQKKISLIWILIVSFYNPPK
jgi:hypothetical protein